MSKQTNKQTKKNVVGNTIKWDINNKLWKQVFIIISAVVFIGLVFVATKSGITGDEFIDGNHGKHSLDFYTKGDTSFLHYGDFEDMNHASHQKYYGVGYEILPAIAIKYFNVPQHEYLIRHLLCALFGFLFMFFAAMTAREIKDWLLASITMLFMALTPIVFGLSMFATKDIPMAAGFSIGFFAFIRILKRLPLFKWQDITLAILGIALALSVRVGGFLLVCYLPVGLLIAIALRKDYRINLFNKPYLLLAKTAFFSFLIILLGVAIGTCFYPNAFFDGPFTHFKTSFEYMTNFPQRIPMIFEGKIIESLSLPDNYLIKSFCLTVPIFALLSFGLFFLNIKSIWKTFDKTILLFLLFTVFFPVVYILQKESAVYNGWRHLTFIYSSFALVGAIGIYQTAFFINKKITSKIFHYIFYGAILAITTPVFVWMVKNYKYCYAYYNVFAGETYLRYDLDYFETASTVAFDWLVKNELKNSTDPVKIAVKNANTIYYGKSKKYDHIGFEKISYRNFAATDVDYGILTIQFTPINVLKTSYPPKGTIHTEYINGKPVCVVVKKDRRENLGIKAISEGRNDEGMKLLEEIYAGDPENFGIWFWMGYGYFHQQKYEKCIDFLTSYMNYYPISEQIGIAKMYIGASQTNLQQYDLSIKTLNDAMNNVTDEYHKKFINAHLAVSYFNKQSYLQAISYFNSVIDVFPNLKTMLYQSYLQIGDNKSANRVLGH